MKKILTLYLILLSTLSFSQRLMLENGDTVPFKRTEVIHKDTSYVNGKKYFPGDTSYIYPKISFILKNGRILNRSVVRKNRHGYLHSYRIGYWESHEELPEGSISKGLYTKNGKKKGTWIKFDSSGVKLSETKYERHLGKSYIIESSEYHNGEKVIKFRESIYTKIHYKYGLFIYITFFFLVWLRILLNGMILNSENEKELGFFTFPFDPYLIEKQRNFIFCMFKFYWNRNELKAENSKYAFVLNIVSHLTIILFLIILVLIFNGQGLT